MNRLLRSRVVAGSLQGSMPCELGAVVAHLNAHNNSNNNKRYNSTTATTSDSRIIESNPDKSGDKSGLLEESHEKSSRGKKLAPPDQEIVILSPERTGMYRRVPNYFHNDNDKSKSSSNMNNLGLDLLTGKHNNNINLNSNSKNSSKSRTKTKSPKFVTQDLANRRKNLMVYSTPESHDSAIDSIAYMKPFNHGSNTGNMVVSVNRYDQMAADLNQAFTVSQLREFGIRYADSALRKSVGFSKFKKTAIVDFILNKMWGITKSKTIAAESDFMVDRFLPLTMRDLFLVLTDYGALIDKWTTNGAMISVQTGGEDPRGNNKDGNNNNTNTIGIHVRAPFKTLTYVEASLSQIITNAAVRELDLATLRHLVDLDAIPFTTIEKQSHVYLDRSIPQTLVAHAINAEKLDHVLRYLVTCLCFGRRRHPEAFVYDLDSNHQQSAAFFRMPVDDQLPWYLRAKEWTRWRHIRQASNNTTLKDIMGDTTKEDRLHRAQYSVEANKSIVNTMASVTPEVNVSDLIDAESGASMSTEASNDSTTSGLGGLIDVFSSSPSSSSLSSSSSSSTPHKHNEIESDLKKSIIQDKVDWLYKSLQGTILSVNQGRYAQLSQDPAQTITYTATFGSLLHHTPSKGSRGKLQQKLQSELNNTHETPTGVQAKAKRTFITTLPYLNQTVNQLSLYNNTDMDLDGGDNSNIIGQDYHDYMVQLSFVPDPFHGAIDECETAPPVEMWIPLDEFDQGDITAAQIVTLNQESSTVLSMPDQPCDLKLAMTNTTAVDFSQVGIHRFLNDCELDFSSEKKIRIPNFLEIEINESQIHPTTTADKLAESTESTTTTAATRSNKRRKVKYVYETMKYRRQIDFEFEGHLLQYVVTEGGALGGRATEANLVLDPTLITAVSETDLKKFALSALKFVDNLADQARQ